MENDNNNLHWTQVLDEDEPDDDALDKAGDEWIASTHLAGPATESAMKELLATPEYMEGEIGVVRAADWKEADGMDGTKKLTEDDVAWTDAELDAMTDNLENDEEAVKLALGLATPEMRALATAKIIGQTGVVE